MSRTASTAARTAILWSTCALFAFSLPLWIFSSLDGFGVERVEIGLDVIDVVEGRLPELAGADAARTFNVAFLGDSMVVSYPPGRTVPERLEQAIQATRGRRPRVEVLSVAAPGMGPFDYYLVADEIAEARPDQVILPFNLAALSEGWRGTFSRPELAGWVRPARIVEALGLPLEWIGLTTDRMLFYMAIVRSGTSPLWQEFLRQQARLGRARTIATTTLEKRVGSTASIRFGTARFRYSDSINVIETKKPGKPGKRKRLSAGGARRRYGPALDGVDENNAVVRVLAAAVSRFREDDIRVLVYANPTNVASLEEVGVLEGGGLEQTLDVIGAAVRGAGGEFADFHALLPDEGFRDAAGHFNVRGTDPDGPELLGNALAPLVLDEARAFVRSQRGRD